MTKLSTSGSGKMRSELARNEEDPLHVSSEDEVVGRVVTCRLTTAHRQPLSHSIPSLIHLLMLSINLLRYATTHSLSIANRTTEAVRLEAIHLISFQRNTIEFHTSIGIHMDFSPTRGAPIIFMKFMLIFVVHETCGLPNRV